MVTRREFVGGVACLAVSPAFAREKDSGIIHVNFTRTEAYFYRNGSLLWSARCMIPKKKKQYRLPANGILRAWAHKPTWFVPPSLRSYYELDRYPYGHPDHPIGKWVITIDFDYGRADLDGVNLHGGEWNALRTPNPTRDQLEKSNGCIRFQNPNIEELVRVAEIDQGNKPFVTMYW